MVIVGTIGQISSFDSAIALQVRGRRLEYCIGNYIFPPSVTYLSFVKKGTMETQYFFTCKKTRTN